MKAVFMIYKEVSIVDETRNRLRNKLPEKEARLEFAKLCFRLFCGPWIAHTSN